MRKWGLIVIAMLLSLSLNAYAQTRVDSLLNQLQEALDALDFDEALEINSQLKSIEPDNPEHMQREASIYIKMAKIHPDGKDYFQNALRLIDEALFLAERKNTSWEQMRSMHHDKMLILLELQNYRAVVEEAQKVLRNDPNDVISNYYLGYALRVLATLTSPMNPPANLIEQSRYYLERAVINNTEGLLIPYAYLFTGLHYLENNVNHEIAIKNLFTWVVQLFYQLNEEGKVYGDELYRGKKIADIIEMIAR